MISLFARWCFAVFLFLLPLVYSFQTQQIFEINKFYLFFLFSGILSFLSIVKIWTEKEIGKTIINTIENKNFWILLTLFWGSIFLSSILSHTPIIAFLGGSARHQGAIFLLALFLLFCFVPLFFSEYDTKKTIKNIKLFCIYPLFCSAIITSFLTIQQSRGREIQKNFFQNQEIRSEEKTVNQQEKVAADQYSGIAIFLSDEKKQEIEQRKYEKKETIRDMISTLFDFSTLGIKDLSYRPFGSLGQPNFMAQLMLIPFFLSLFFVFFQIQKIKAIIQRKQEERIIKNFIFLLAYLSFAGLFLYSIYLSGGRSAQLGVVSGLYFLLLFFISFALGKDNPQKTQTLFFSGTAIFIGMSIFLFLLCFFSPEIIHNIFQERSRSILARFQFWKEALPLLTNSIHSFLFGIGSDQLGTLFQPISSVKLNELEGFSYTPDRTHSLFLDTFLHYGVIAGLIFWGTLVHILKNALSQIFHPQISEEIKHILLFIFAGIIATFVSWMTGFPVTADAVICTVVISVLSLLSHSSLSKK